MIPTTITTDDSIGIIYTTVIQFAYLMEGDEGNYTCAVTIDEDSTDSTFNLEIISMHECMYVQVTTNYQCLHLPEVSWLYKDVLDIFGSYNYSYGYNKHLFFMLL